MDTPVCDLVLLSWNHLEETKPCLESLLASTRVPCRLFIVDNGSEQDVRAFLATVRPQGAIKDVVVLQNEQNEGFPRGMNRGIHASTAPYVCLLNNDLRFTAGWLQEMIEIAQANPTVGVMNPTSSTFGNYPPRGVSLQAYADRLRSFRGQYTEVGMCIGFCMLVKREVLDRIGGLNEEPVGEPGGRHSAPFSRGRMSAAPILAPSGRGEKPRAGARAQLRPSSRL